MSSKTRTPLTAPAAITAFAPQANTSDTGLSGALAGRLAKAPAMPYPQSAQKGMKPVAETAAGKASRGRQGLKAAYIPGKGHR
ncbi:hypothetical protein [Nitratireductor basaltis]|uniref:Uncharacterized protein n=1 Tax=Nitratireductor basaltis TaxID=472175 RepID=A0A084U933_9HYPH|nr:hypothetical protein [Nitratireductor basaltis]KFB09469.1 hypothetical protein EL18_00485 [Nitratireductor basaltis]